MEYDGSAEMDELNKIRMHEFARRQLMLRNASSPTKPGKSSDDVKIIRIPWLTNSRASCILRVWNLLPKVSISRQLQLIFIDSYAVPKWSAGATSKGVTN